MSVLLYLATLLAYFIKGFGGFGPAMIIVPVFALIAGTNLALAASALLDAAAGLILLRTVWPRIDWQFVWPVMAAIAGGSFLGARTAYFLPEDLLLKIMGFVLLIFVIYLFFQDNRPAVEAGGAPRWGTIAAGLLAGLLGGLSGMSGPPLVAYLKYYYPKEFFRTQLIVIFLAEKFIRLLVYGRHQMLPWQEWPVLFTFLPMLLLGLWIGTRLHGKVSEKQFTRTVALILIFPAVKLIFF
ncbi:MAG: sulfite exporter TauE/SafE family protein [Calditrichia bacterium]